MPGTFTRKASDLGIYYANYPTGCGKVRRSARNGHACRRAAPLPTTTPCPETTSIRSPTRASAHRVAWQINDDWDALITQTYQDMNARGVFYQMPFAPTAAKLQPLQVTLFSPSSDKDRFENTAWTLNGKVGPLQAIYTGAYLVRNLDQTQRLHELRARRVCGLLPMLWRKGQRQRCIEVLLSGVVLA